MDSQQTLKINGNTFSFEDGDTVLEVARRNGIYIPTLCHLDQTKNTGACRVCLVEVKGARGLVASCAMPAGPGMEVRTDTPKVVEARRLVIALLMISGNHNCAAKGAGGREWTDFQLEAQEYDGGPALCDAYGSCELQALAYKYQAHDLVAKLRLDNLETRYPLEDASDYILRDFSRCILCGRCVKACNEIQVNNAISFGYRGAEAKIVTRGDVALGDSDCVFCGECVQVCPVAALVEKDNRYGAHHWDLERTRTTCGHCGVGCAVDVFTKDGTVIRTSGVKSSPVNHGSLCRRGRYETDLAAGKERVLNPMVKDGGAQSQASWDAALSSLHTALTGIRDAHGGEAVAGLVSGSVTNEDAFAMQRYFSEVLGSVNLVSPAGSASGGEGHVAPPLSDLDLADLVLVVGADLTSTHPVAGAAVKRASRREGGSVIVIDSGEPDIARYAQLHLQPKAGTELAVLRGIAGLIIAKGGASPAAASGLDAAAQTWTPAKVQDVTGVSEEDLREAAEAYASASAAATVYGDGVLGSPESVRLVDTLEALAGLCGNLGIPGGGLHPLRERCNTQGVIDQIKGTEGVTRKDLPQAIREGRIKALISMGGDPAELISGLGALGLLDKLELLVIQDLAPGKSAPKAHHLLPGLTSLEADGTFTNSGGRVQRVRPVLTPAGAARAPWSVFSDLAGLADASLGLDGSSEIFQQIARATDGYSSMSHAALDSSGGARKSS